MRRKNTFFKTVTICSFWKAVRMLFLFLLISASTFAQQVALDSLHKRFDRYRITFPQEKLYVHTNQDTYLVGETLWFKIYYTDGARHYPIDISKVAYVEVLDANNQPVLQTKVALKRGEGNGALFLPASINSGNYHFRAYTQWMKNFSADHFFHKTISVVNSFKKLEPTEVKAAKDFTVEFFPEGGNLVDGAKSKIAFKATNGEGKGINFSGVILNSSNDTLASIKPHKFGIGNFELTPQPGQAYSAVITDSLGKQRKIARPPAKSEGLVMQVKDSTSGALAITISATYPTNRPAPVVYYFIHARQVVSAAGIRHIEHGKTTIFIPKDNLGEGISHITLFDEYLRPQCERLYFKPVKKKLVLNVRGSQGDYGMRRKVILDISSANALKSVSASLAVIKSDSIQQNVKGNIFNYLWLTSDLKGEVESPDYYLQNTDPEVAAAVDNLMLTHGWRRFNWSNVVNGKQNGPEFIPEYRGHLVRGVVLDSAGKPAAGIASYLASIGKNIQLYTGRSKQNGEVQFEMKDFWGAKKVIVQTNTQFDSTFRINIQDPFSKNFSNRDLPAFTLQPVISKTLVNRSISMQVQDIYHGESTLKFKTTGVDSTAFYGKADETYFLDDFTRFPVMEEVMREYVPGVMVRKRRDGFHFLVLDDVRKGLFQDNPLVLLDGLPIFDIDKIMAFDPLKVKKLEVVRRKYSFGPLVFPGIVSYSTYAGDLGGFQLDPKSVSIDYEGLQRERVYYTPQYENEKSRASRLPDQRNLLLWEPTISLNAGEKKQIEFFTSDLTGEYTVVIEGISSDGACGSTTMSFNVKDFNN